MSTSTEIISIEEYKLPDLFDPDNKELFEKFLKHVEKQALAEVCDATTEEGRKRIWNIKNQVVAVEKTIDGFGKKIQEDAKAVVDQTNAIRRSYRDRLTVIKNAVMKPRVEWEEKEAARQAKHREAIQAIKMLGDNVDNSLTKPQKLGWYLEQLENLGKVVVDSSFEEFEDEARSACESVKSHLDSCISVMKEEIERDEKLARLEAEAEERRKEDERRAIAEKAKEDARKEFEAEQERKRIAEEQSQKQTIVSDSNGLRIQDAPDHGPTASSVPASVTEPAHTSVTPSSPSGKGKIHREALDALMKLKNAQGFPIFEWEDQAKDIVIAIVKGQIPHVTINYSS